MICMKRIVATAPAFIYGKEEEVVVPLNVLLKEVLICYQKCILCRCVVAVIPRSGKAVHVNACSELFLSLVNKRILTLQKDNIPAFWNLVCEISRVVMGDAPLLDIFGAKWEETAEKPEEEEDDSEKGGGEGGG